MTERDYKKEYRDYHAKPENMADRVKRNLWNRRLKGQVPAGKEIDHKSALASGGSNDKSNIRFRAISENRADKSMLKQSAWGAAVGAYASDDGLENRAKGAAAGQVAGWVATPPALALAGEYVRRSTDAKIDGVRVKDMSTKQLVDVLKNKPQTFIDAVGRKKTIAAFAGVPMALGTIASYGAGKVFGRGQREKTASIEYRGQTFQGYNKPQQAPPGDDHKMVVLAKKGDEVKLVRFGKRGYEHNYSPEAKKNYLTRSAGIRDKNGNLTKDDKFSPNHWARKVLWPKNQEADGTSTITKDKHMSKESSYEISYTDRHALHKYAYLKKTAMGAINRQKWNEVLNNLEQGDILLHNTDQLHYADVEGLKKGVKGAAVSGGIKAITGSPTHHIAMAGKGDDGKMKIWHMHESSGGKLMSMDPEEYINQFGKHTDIKAVRPNLPEDVRAKSIDYVKKNVGSKYAYGDLPAHAAKQVADKVGLGGIVEKAHSLVAGGVKKCNDATGVCSTVPAKAYSESVPDFVEKHLGVKSGTDHRLISPKDYEDALKKGLMQQVGDYQFADRDLSAGKAVARGAVKDVKSAIGSGAEKLKRIANAIGRKGR